MRGDFFDTQADIIDEAQNSTSFPVLLVPFGHPTCPSSNMASIQTHAFNRVLTFSLSPWSTDLVVARIDRKLLSGKDIFFGQQTYGVQIAPGVDMALIAALCICLDEKNNEG